MMFTASSHLQVGQIDVAEIEPLCVYAILKVGFRRFLTVSLYSVDFGMRITYVDWCRIIVLVQATTIGS